MITLGSLAEIAPRFRGGFLAIGNFDGVHQGHTNLVARLREKADAARVPALALTFDPHPAALLHPERAPAPLLWVARKAGLLQSAGASEVGVFQTGPWLLGLSAREFFDRVVVGQFAARGLVEGPNFAFGRDRAGNNELLAAWCASSGMDFEELPPAIVDGSLVSSSRIRQLLSEGAVSEAAAMLGRPHRVRGVIAHGAGRGAKLGFPTANLEGSDTLIPANGVYAAFALIDGRPPAIPAACHVGPNATFGEQARTVEAHLLDFQGQIYGRTITLDFLKRLRGTFPFDGVDALLDQIRRDVAETRSVCLEYPAPG